MGLGRLRILVIDDLLNAFQRPRTYIFLVPFGLFWFWALRALSTGKAAWFQSPEGSMIASWLLTPEVAQGLLEDRPPTLALFYFLALGSAPFFSMLATFDQTSSDARTGYLRFLTLRCSRGELYVSRLLAASSLLIAAIILAGVAATAISVAKDGFSAGEVIRYSLRLHLALALYATAFAAIMATLSAVTTSGALAALFGMSGYALILAWTFYATLELPSMAITRYLLPSGVKDLLLAGRGADIAFALLFLGVYAALWGSWGWLVFRRRDL